MTRREFCLVKLAALSVFLMAGSSVGAQSGKDDDRTIQGTWTGDFGAGTWTFKFENNGKDWAGRYTYPQYGGWNPVINLAASDRFARFSLKARTAVDFNLKLEPSNKSLSGTVRFAHGMTAKSPPVILPVQLKRM